MLEFLAFMVTDYKQSTDKSKTENLVSSIRKAYDTTLKRHHGFVAKQLFKVGTIERVQSNTATRPGETLKCVIFSLYNAETTIPGIVAVNLTVISSSV
jgi:hypothetical protein